MAGLSGLRRFPYVALAVAWTLGGLARAEPLQLVTDGLRPFSSDLHDEKVPGYTVEVLRQVFAAMGQDVSLEQLPWNRGWLLISRGERDGLFTALRTSDRERICHFSDEPMKWEKWVLFIRSADAGRLKFSSFDDLVGHDVAVHEPVHGVFSQPTVSLELEEFLREHHNMVETPGTVGSLRMLAAGRVDYAVANLTVGMRDVAAMGLSGKIEPLLSRSVIEGDFGICFSKARVEPIFVDRFSRALRQFKQTDAFQAIYRKYFPTQAPSAPPP
jgi:polar amino acid transport system substrate-binding protein